MYGIVILTDYWRLMYQPGQAMKTCEHVIEIRFIYLYFYFTPSDARLYAKQFQFTKKYYFQYNLQSFQIYYVIKLRRNPIEISTCYIEWLIYVRNHYYILIYNNFTLND